MRGAWIEISMAEMRIKKKGRTSCEVRGLKLARETDIVLVTGRTSCEVRGLKWQSLRYLV